MKKISLSLLIAGMAFFQAHLPAAESQLWTTDQQGNVTWDPRLPDFTNVGYMNGDVVIPDWPVGVDVTDPQFGAVPDDDQDDSDAFIAAIAACPVNKAVFVPKGRYIITKQISIDRDYVVLQGEDMYETVLFFPKYLNEVYVQEVGYENPDYFSPGNGYRNTGESVFILMPGGTHRSIENLSIEFREQTKIGHWAHKGGDGIRNSSTHSWMRNIYVKNGDHCISTSGGQYITVQNIVIDQFIDRNKVAVEQEGSRVGHMAMHLNDTDDNLFHNILFTGAWSHGFDTKQTHGCVISHVKSPRGAAAYHGQGVRDNLYTDFEVNYYAGSPNSNNPINETFWGIYSPDGDLGMDPVHPDDTLYAYNLELDGHIIVGYDVDSLSLPTKSNPDFWYENIDATQLSPLNLYLAQMEEVGKPVPATPQLQAPDPYTGDVIRIKAVGNGSVDAANPDQTYPVFSGDDYTPLRTKISITNDPYLKFDLSAIDPAELTNIHRVRLRLATEEFKNTPVELGIFSVTNDAWTENTITFNNKPAQVALLDSYQVNEDTQATVMEFDVTAFVQDQWANDPNKEVSFNLDILSGNGFSSAINSINNGFGPILIIEQVADPVADAPSAPTEVRATSLIGNVLLDWPDNPESDVVSYNVYRSYVSADLKQYTFPIGMGLTTSDFIDIQHKHWEGWDVGMLRDDIPYFYRVTAVDKHGNESESSHEIIASAKSYLDDSLPPAFSQDPIILPKATQYVTNSDSLAGSAIDPEGDTVYYAKLDGPDWVQVAPDGSVTATPRAGDTGTFQFTVVVSALYGGHDEATVILTVDPAVPDAPLLRDIIPGDGSIQLDWDHDAEGTANFTFSVYRATSATGPFSQIASGLMQSDYADSGLNNGTTYYYLITASNNSGESPISELTSATPIAGFSVGTTYIGGGLITDPASWDNGLPIGQWGRIDIDASVDTAISLDGYQVLHTGGELQPTGISGLKLINGSQWITEGPTATTATSFRGFGVSSGSSFTLNSGNINTKNGRDWSLSDANSAITINGGTLNLGRSLKISGTAGPIFALNGGTVNGNLSSGYIGGNNISDNTKTMTFDGGTMTAYSLDLSGDNTTAEFGGTTAGSLSVENILGFGSNSAINFLPGSRMSLSVSSASNWAETYWNSGNLTYNGQGTAALGSWATVTAANGLEPGVQFAFDGGTGTLSLTQAMAANQPPAFSNDTIERFDASEAVAYTGSIAGDASDPESDPMTFSRLSGPAWLSVAANGDLSGTPSSSDTGLNSFLVQLSDGNGGSDTATLEITVENINDAPVFINDPIAGDAAAEDEVYEGSLYGSANDQDGDILAYTKTGGPAWLNVAPLGNLSGTPGNDDVGLNSFTIEVSDGNGGIDTAVLEITVTNSNDVPVFGNDPLTGFAATEEAGFNGSLSGTASDDDNDTLSYSKTGGPAWLSVASDGVLSGTPGNDDVGLNSFTVEVTDGNGGSDSAVLEVTVVNVNDAPVFTSDPIVGADATENTFYSSTLAGSASDVDVSDILSFSKVSGPDWLNIAADGDLYGTPETDDLGLNSFTVSVSDGHNGSDTAVLEITVVAGSSPTVFTDADANDSLISNPGNWSNGLPTGGALGTIAINAKHDSGFTHVGYHVIHTDGAVTKTGFSGLKLGAGSIWEMNGASAQVSSTRGMSLAGALFIMNEGTADLTENTSDSSLNAGSELIINGGSMDMGRSLLFNGGDLTVSGGTLNIAADMGSRNFHGGGNANLGGGSVSADLLTFGQDTFQVNFGGSAAGTLIVSNFGGNRADVNHIDINFEPGTQVSMQLTNPVESGASGDGDLGWSAIGSETGLSWAEALWSDGRLTYNEQDYTTLGSWAAVTSDGLGDGYGFAYDSGTNTLSLISINQAPAFNSNPVLELAADEDVAYSASLADNAYDNDVGASLTFAKVSGPAWLIVGTDGSLSGTPLNTDAGLNSWTVSVSDGIADPVEATLEIFINQDTAAPDEPANFAGTAENGYNSLTWDSSSAADFASYKVYRSETAGGPYTEIAFDLSTNQYEDSNITEGTTYYYVVTALDDNGNESVLSGEQSVTSLVSNIVLAADYPFNGSSSASVDTDLNTSASTLAQGPDLNASYDTRTFGVRGNPVPSLKWTHGDIDDATVLDGDYLAFSVSSDVDGMLPQELSFDFSGESLDIYLFSDEVGFSSVGDAIASFTVSAGLNNYVIPLDSLSAVAESGSREFRLYFQADGTKWSGTEVWIDNITLSAEIGVAPTLNGPQLATATLNGIGDSWTVVNLQATYNSPVIVASVALSDSNQLPVVARIRNVGADSFELRVQNPSGEAIGTYDVHIVVVEEGVYNALEHGVDMEAFQLLSTGTNKKNNWSNTLMEQVATSNTYTSPVVLGQVMSANDANWSSFWSCDGNRGNPATASSIFVGKHVGEDSVTTRADETIGVIILESGSATVEGINFTAAVGADIVKGVGNGEPFTYSLTGLSTVSEVAVSASGMDGVDGGWPVLYGTTPVTTTSLDLVFDEDQTGDIERGHTSEQVSYLVFE
ncbi:Ig-like domain-containing protein [Coraliomargarita sinensis]|nr:putative Ig domain-containing protein [Coraliomargarita sinensis]